LEHIRSQQVLRSTGREFLCAESDGSKDDKHLAIMAAHMIQQLAATFPFAGVFRFPFNSDACLRPSLSPLMTLVLTRLEFAFT
jgi:hypothetical protein